MFIVGIDLASSSTGDYSVFTVVEKDERATRPHYSVRYIHRWPLGTEYPQLVQDVVRMLDRPPLPGCTVVVDSTGVGLAFFQSLRQALAERTRQARAPAVLIPVVITGGIYAAPAKGGWSVPKRDLVSILVALLGEQRLTIAEIPEKALLIKELRTFSRKISPTTSHDSYEAMSSRDHDDIICSASLACWYGERCWRPAGSVRAYRTGLTAVSFLKIAILDKVQLADEACTDHASILVSCNSPGDDSIPEHKLKLIEAVAVQCLDATPEDKAAEWNETVAAQLLGQQEAKKIWSTLKRQRSPAVPVELIAVADHGNGDRRALSVAFALADALARKRSSTVLRVGVENWIATDTSEDLELTNRHIYDTVKAANALVLGSVPLKPSPPAPKMLSFAGHPIPGFIRGVHG
jgi:hypothetical protein